MIRVLLRLLTVLAALLPLPLWAASPAKWDTFADVSVIWSAKKGVDAYRFDGLANESSAESGCYGKKTEIVTVLSQQLYTRNRADDLFRGRAANGSVESYRIPLNDAPRAVDSWLSKLVEEGQKLRVQSVTCGMGGFVYVTQISKVARAR